MGTWCMDLDDGRSLGRLCFSLRMSRTIHYSIGSRLLLIFSSKNCFFLLSKSEWIEANDC
jgi:hypothetical protein